MSKVAQFIVKVIGVARRADNAIAKHKSETLQPLEPIPLHFLDLEPAERLLPHVRDLLARGRVISKDVWLARVQNHNFTFGAVIEDKVTIVFDILFKVFTSFLKV